MLNLTPAIPEIVVLAMASTVLLADVFSRDPGRRLTFWLSQATLLAALVLTLQLMPEGRELAFSGTFVSDPMSALLKAAIYVICFVVFIYAREYLAERGLLKGEFFVLGLFAVLGMMVMASAQSLLTVYLGLELLSLCLYAMVALHRESSDASEAAMKYFVLGAIASGMLLYGMSILYGITGTLDLAEVAAALTAQGSPSILMVFALVFIIVGVAFKLGAVPFHMWVPDVYQGAPTAVTLFIASAPKVAAFALAIRLLVDGLGPLAADWQGILIILALASMGIGNVVAIAQVNLKRMLAYSTIAHVGYLLLGILSASSQGYAASMFYVIVYALMSMGTFGVIILLGRAGFESDRLDDFKGLAARSPWFALVMLILMFSMAGVPPFVGFWAKWFVLKEAVASGFVWVAVLAVVFSIIGAFYYLRMVKLMYFDEPELPLQIRAGAGMRLVLSINGLAVLLLGLMPGLLMAVCLAALAG